MKQYTSYFNGIFHINIRYAFHMIYYYYESFDPENRELNKQKGQNH